MSGIKCHECGAVVTRNGAITRLAADGVKWTGDTATRIGPDHIHFSLKSSAGLADVSPAIVNNPPESGVLAEQYNNQQYKCINGHSGKWVTNK